MARALELARRGEGMTRPNPPVGAVIVRGARIVGEGFHERAGEAHAEVHALAKAGRRARGATLYVTLEPCCTWGRTPPCAAAIIESGIRRVVAAARDPNPRHRGRGLALLRRKGVAVTEGVRRAEAEALIEPFAKWIATGRPFLTLKLAVSADGKIADASGRSRWITGAAARAEVQALRRRADAVVVGARTARLDDPSLLPRPRGRGKPFRIVMDSKGELPLTARVLNDGAAAQTIIATTRRCAPARRAAYLAKGAAVWKLRGAGGGVSVAALMARAGRMGLLHLVCEGGGALAASCLRAGAADEILLYVAPRIIGGRAAPGAVGGPGWALDAGPALEFVEVRMAGGDILVRARPADRGDARRSPHVVQRRRH